VKIRLAEVAGLGICVIIRLGLITKPKSIEKMTAHGHHHTPTDFSQLFAIGIGLNIAFVVIEIVFGLLANSLALLADAGHNISDVLSLLLAWGASRIAGWRPTTRRTYGYRRATILASVVSSIFLLIAMGGIAWEALGRFAESTEVDAMTVMSVAGVGVVINGFTAWLLASGSAHDLNVKAAFLHMVADAGVSFGVVVGAIAIMAFNWQWLDPVITLIIAVIIVISTWSVFRDSVDLAFDAVPKNIDPEKVREYLAGLSGVKTVHDLHIWAMSTTETALTAHLVMPSGLESDKFLNIVAEELQHIFGIAHATIQVEQGDADHGCEQDC
jgi:cobalt-zinc-cadmium efflux system protein